MAEFDNGKYVVTFSMNEWPAGNRYQYLHLSVWHRDSEVGSEISKTVDVGKTPDDSKEDAIMVQRKITEGIAILVAELMESIKPEGFADLI